jgi:hypothetical protein
MIRDVMLRPIPIHSWILLPANNSRLFASGNIKRQFKFILELDGAARGGNRPNLIIALADGKISRGPELITIQPDARGDGLSAGNPVQSQFSV